jgi:hypothetical protein
VKGGEDVRTDERMEQILDVCNGLLARHPGASTHQLQVSRTSFRRDVKESLESAVNHKSMYRTVA